MTTRDQKTMLDLARAIDTFTTQDLTALGVSPQFFAAQQKVLPGPMCLGAADRILSALPPKGGRVIIATGFPMGAGVPETDGPVGAAFLARALYRAVGAQTVIVTDEGWENVVGAACIGAGISPQPLRSGGVREEHYLRQVFIRTVPRDRAESHAVGERILDDIDPHLMIAVERPGKNEMGRYHGMNGRTLEGWVADLDHMFEKARERGITILGVGDGGNELGMGLIQDAVLRVLPQARSCGCGCGGGTAAVTPADFLVVSCVSNWGCTGIIAALALTLGRMDIMHEPEWEQRAIELTANAGGVDGGSLSPVPAVDGIPALEWAGLVRAMRGMVRRGMDIGADWRTILQSEMKA
ncbi:MAG: DUF4392 domain-containing protein [Desulfovibrionaceae bacterium]|jgi:hypothetical protein|nr:DUF4392 domain-containing protein [Desulfovibrionaceae bacterium]